MKRYLVFFISKLVQLIAAHEARILVPPVAVNISLNEEAVFNCTAAADHINWRANSTPVDDITDKGFFGNMLPVPINETENIYLSQLRVVGSDFSNATMIACRVNILAMNVYTVATSEPVLLLVQGSLNAVTKLNTEIFNSTTLFISWSPPYTLLGVPILFYRVKTNSFNMTVVNATTMYYPIQPSQNNVEVTVVPVNRVGDGVAATLSTNITFITTTCTFVNKAHSDSINALIQLQTTPFTTTTTTSPITISPPTTTKLIKPKQTPTPASGMETEIMIMNLYIWTTAAAVIFLLIVTVITVVIICTTCIIWRKKSVKFNPNDVFVITQENPAYATVKVMSNAIVTQKNRAYEEVIRTPPTMQH